MNIHRASLAGLLLLVCSLPVSAEFRTWTKRGTGQTIEAEFLWLKDNSIKLRMKSGEEVAFDVRILTDKDQQLARRAARAAVGRKGARDVAIVPEERKPAKWALLIGVENYDELPPLEFCDEDSVELGKCLATLGFPKDQIFVLSSSSSDKFERPQHQIVQHTLDRLLGIVDEQGKIVQQGLVGDKDLVVVSFSGHGAQIGGVSYFCPSDAKVDHAEETMISVPDVYARLSTSKADFKLLLVDACRNVVKPRAVQREKTQFKLKDPPANTAILAVTSCNATEQSIEDRKLGHGVFTYFVLEALRGAAGRPDERGMVAVRASHLHSHVVARTKQYASLLKPRHNQTPVVMGRVPGDPVLGLVKATTPDESWRKPVGPAATAYALDLASVKSGDLPTGWKGDGMVGEITGVKVLRSAGTKGPKFTLPPLDLKGDFFVEFTALTLTHKSAINVRMTGKPADLSIDAQHHGQAGWNLTVPGGIKKYLPSFGPTNFIPEPPRFRELTLIRLERQGKDYFLSINGNRGEMLKWTADDAAAFDGMKIELADDKTLLAGLRMGALTRAKPGATKAAVVSFAGRSLPNGWIHSGQRRVAARELAMRGDFLLRANLESKHHSACMQLTLIGESGSSLPILYHQVAWNKITVLMGGLRISAIGSGARRTREGEVQNTELALQRQGDSLKLLVNGTVAGRLDTGGLGDFQSCVLDYCDKYVEVQSLRINPSPED